jgi:MFS family permease
VKNSQVTSETQQGAQSARSLWRNSDFLLLWSGQTVSMLGTSISALALPLLMLALTHSPALTGFFFATRQIPYLLFSLPAGALVDRWDRKKTMIFCDLVRWLVLGSVPLAYVLGHLTLVQLYLAAFIEGTAYVLFSLAQISALPQVVAPEHLSRAYALDTIMEYIGTLCGPSLGAFIIGLVPVVEIGALLAYLVDSLSYLVSVLSLLGMRVSFQVERVKGQEPRKLYQEIVEGLRFLWGKHDLRSMALLTSLANFLFSPLDLILIVLAQNKLHLSVQFLGLLLNAGGVGGILGGVIAPWIRVRLRCGQILLISVCIWMCAALLLALASWPPLLIVGKCLLSFTWPAYGVAVVSYRLALTPDNLRGRVNSAFRSLSFGSEPLGAALGGLLLVFLGAQTMFGLVAVGFVGCILQVLGTGLRNV